MKAAAYTVYLTDPYGTSVDLPAWMLGEPGSGGGHRVDLFVILLRLGVAWLLHRGINNSARIGAYLVFIKIAIVLAVIVVGVCYIKADKLTPYVPFGFSGVAAGAATVFFAVF